MADHHKGVILARKELEHFLMIFQSYRIPGVIEFDKDTELDENVWNSMLEKEYLIKDADDKIVVDPLIQLALLTVINPEAALRVNKKSKASSEIFGLYLHGETIIFLETLKDSSFYSFLWLPVLPLAIGAVVKQLTGNPDETYQFEGMQLTKDNSGVSMLKTLDIAAQPCDEGNYTVKLSEEGIDWQTVSKESLVHTLTRWLAHNHAESLRKVVG